MKNKKINKISYSLLFVILVFLSVGDLFAQTNFVKEKIYTSKTEIGTTEETYYDGLGRVLQNISRDCNNKGVVTFTDYDNYGRERRKYLPYPTSVSGYNVNAESSQWSYYQSNFYLTSGYSENVYDNTTNSNIIEQSFPGHSRMLGSGHTQKNRVTKNLLSDNVKGYEIVNDTTVAHKGYYPAGRLIKKEAIDPQGDKVYQYYDAANQLIAMENRADTVSRFTYYLYDDFGKLRYVIPSAAEVLFGSRERKNLQELKKYCFYIEYDERQRAYKNYVPGAGYTINLYDNKDRLVLSQTQSMRAQGKWMFTKFDMFDRPVIFGVCSGTEAQHKAGLNSQTIFSEIRESFAHGYSNQAYPTAVSGNDYLTVTYYDDYDWQGESQETLSVSAWSDPTFPCTINNRVTGRVTGSKHKILGIADNKWLLSAKYYDDQYNEIQSVSQLYPEGLELVYKQYDYVGKLTRVLEKQTVGTKLEGFNRYMEYDAQGRLSNVKQQILGSSELVSIAKYTYNDLWQIVEKTNHNGIDTTRFLYNMDGQQIGANSSLFSYKLYMDQKPDNMTYAITPRYDGNICFMEWRSGNTTRGYRYDFDAFKQLKDASYGSVGTDSFWVMGKEYGEHDIDYDLNGNITKLRRTDGSNYPLHSIDNSYNGNQLTYALINNTKYAYSYDENGNLIYDGYKGINISYNLLDLPEKIFAGADEVSYIYSAAGKKLATKVGDSFTYYRGSFIYNNDELDHMIHPEGIARKASGGYVYYYAKRDHMGSTRILCHEANGKMMADQTTDYYTFGLTFRNPSTNYNRYLYSGKELQDQYVNGNRLLWYDFGARNYDPVLGRWFNIDPALQFANPYSYCGNNPVMFTDPDGEFLFTILNAIKDFFVNTFVKSWKQGWNAWSNKDNWHSTTMAFKIDVGLFKGNFGQVISRLTWELPQTILGHFSSQAHNLFYGVNSVSYYRGATAVESYGDIGGAFTLGSFIVGNRGMTADPKNSLFQHEYGHYLQSQRTGLFYLQRYAIPSVIDAGGKSNHKLHATEQDANVRAYKYFMKNEQGFNNWDDGQNPIKGYNWNLDYNDSSNQAALNNGIVRLKWWDYVLGPQIIIPGLINNGNLKQ